MQSISRLTAALLSLSLFLSLPASADTIHRTVPAGKSTRLGGMAFYHADDCGFAAKPKVTIPVEPAHGTVKVTWGNGKINDAKRATKCAGKPIRAMEVFYHPHNGYRGPDVFKVGIRSQYDHSTGSDYFAVTINITVK